MSRFERKLKENTGLMFGSGESINQFNKYVKEVIMEIPQLIEDYGMSWKYPDKRQKTASNKIEYNVVLMAFIRVALRFLKEECPEGHEFTLIEIMARFGYFNYTNLYSKFLKENQSLSRRVTT